MKEPPVCDKCNEYQDLCACAEIEPPVRSSEWLGRVLTCVYCGNEYPQDSPSWGNQVLTDHIKVCEKHPMRQLEADNAKLRKALVGLVGADTMAELEGMEAAIRVLPVPDEDRMNTINAIHALRDTQRPNAEVSHAGESGVEQH